MVESEQNSPEQHEKPRKSLLPERWGLGLFAIGELTGLRNPGRVDQYNKEAKVILTPDFWEGVRFDFNKQVTPHFGIGHGISMGDQRSPPMYHFSANYASLRTRLFGRIDTTGLLNARADQQLTNRIMAHFSAQMTSAQAHGQLELDYSGSDYTATASLGSGGYRLGYLQAVTPTLSLGAVLSTDSQTAPGFQVFVRRAGAKSIFTTQATFLIVSPLSPFAATFPGTLGPLAEAQAAYVHKVADNVSFATELRFDATRMRTHATVGYQYEMRMGMFTGHVASNGMIGSVLEHRMTPGVAFLLSGYVDYVRSEYSFGFGMNIG